MRTLDRSAPYTTTFGPDTASIPFFQNGLYYNQAGDLVDMAHNRMRLAALGKNADEVFATGTDPEKVVGNQLKQSATAAPPAPAMMTLEQTIPPPAVADPTDPLAGKSDAQLFAIAERLRAQLDVSEDGDNYVPTIDNAVDNRGFIIRHLAGAPDQE